MSRKLQTQDGAAIYARRKAIVEPVIGPIKHARGFRQFTLRDPTGCSGMAGTEKGGRHSRRGDERGEWRRR
jgi:hypothetical protein